MTPSERSARAYCQSIGADPDEIVWAYRGNLLKAHNRRWRFYALKHGEKS